MLKSHADIIGDQIDTLLNALATVNNVMRRSSDEQSHDEHVKTSLEGTAIRICNRLDAILDDADKWALPKTDGHAVLSHSIALRDGLIEQQLFRLELQKQLALGKITTSEPASAQPKTTPRKKK
ncbi:MAG TPA: hypothetical protein VEH04_17155 [Verrucomicrobiae bacterium]|nr:hypothetical protein [Verrucomicrobiae bacterium]